MLVEQEQGARVETGLVGTEISHIDGEHVHLYFNSDERHTTRSGLVDCKTARPTEKERTQCLATRSFRNREETASQVGKEVDNGDGGDINSYGEADNEHRAWRSPSGSGNGGFTGYNQANNVHQTKNNHTACLLYTSPSPRDS